MVYLYGAQLEDEIIWITHLALNLIYQSWFYQYIVASVIGSSCEFTFKGFFPLAKFSAKSRRQKVIAKMDVNQYCPDVGLLRWFL
jgi:hypothetical protein